MDDDGLDGVVIGKLLELLDDLLGRENYAIEFNHGNPGPEAGKRFFIPAAKTQEHQREHCDDEQRKQPAAHHKPYPDPRTPFSHDQTSVAPAASRVHGKTDQNGRCHLTSKFFGSSCTLWEMDVTETEYSQT